MGINYDIKKHIAILSSRIDRNDHICNTELNLIAWNGHEPRFDIREWREDHGQCSYGVQLNADEMENLVNGFQDYKRQVK